MTDKEIIKALECCKMPVGSGACNGCPLKTVRDSLRKEDTKSCTTILLENALDLINLQQAEIEKLTVNKNAYGLGMQRLAEQLETAKSEAIKKFSERLKAVSHPYADTQMVFELQIDNLVKEMTEVREK